MFLNVSSGVFFCCWWCVFFMFLCLLLLVSVVLFSNGCLCLATFDASQFSIFHTSFVLFKHQTNLTWARELIIEPRIENPL